MRKMFFIFLSLLLPYFSFAATLRVNPEYPKPHEKYKVEVELKAGEYNPDISWFVNDELQNEKSNTLELQAGKLGEKTKIKVLLSYPDRAPEILKLEVMPIMFDILYEADTFSPGFLNLAPLASFGSNIKLQAILNIPGYSNKDLLFIWKKDGKSLPYISGEAKDTVTVSSDFYSKSHFIELEIWDPKETKLLFKKGVYILLSKPQIEYYIKDSTLGWLFERSLSNTLYLKDKEEVLAIPFNFSVKSIFSPLLDWTWAVNGRKLDSPESKSPYVEMSFKTQDVNTATVELLARHKKLPLQYTSSLIELRRSNGKNKIIHKIMPNEKTDSGFGI